MLFRKIITVVEWHNVLHLIFGVKRNSNWITYNAHSLQWHRNESDGVSNHRRLDCLLKHLFGRRSQKTSKHRHRNEKVVRMTALIFTGDVEDKLQRLKWIPRLSTWLPFRFCGVTGLFEWNPPVIDGCPSQRANNAEMFPFDDVIMSRNIACFCIFWCFRAVWFQQYHSVQWRHTNSYVFTIRAPQRSNAQASRLFFFRQHIQTDNNKTVYTPQPWHLMVDFPHKGSVRRILCR